MKPPVAVEQGTAFKETPLYARLANHLRHHVRCSVKTDELRYALIARLNMHRPEFTKSCAALIRLACSEHWPCPHERATAQLVVDFRAEIDGHELADLDALI